MRKNKQTSALVNCIDWYVKHSPIKFGSAKLRKYGLRSLGASEIETESVDGVTFFLHMPEDASWFSIYYDGHFETGTFELMKKIIRKDDIVLDIGANLGWYTAHIAKRIPIKHCYAFEPVPSIFKKLERHCAVNQVTNKVTLNNCALGDKDGTIELHTFPDLPHGHSSISTLGKTNYVTSTAPIVMLDNYIAENNLDKIDFIKMDVEGAEMLVLKGAKNLLQRKDPPVWVIEMNIETAASFGHKPADLLKEITQYNSYELFKVEAGWGKTTRMSSIDDYQNGDNAVLIPSSKKERINSIV